MVWQPRETGINLKSKKGEIIMTNFKFELGQIVKDKVTGFIGVVVCRSQYLTGCNRYAIQARIVTPEGKIPEWVYFDEDLMLVEGENINIEIKLPGGPVAKEAPRR